MLATAVFACILGVELARRDASTLAAALVREDVLRALFAVNAGLLVFRLWSVADAYRIAAHTRPPRRSRAGRVRAALALLALACVTALPHVVVGWVLVTMSDTLETVFAAEEPRDVLGGSLNSPLDGGGGPTFLTDTTPLVERPFETHPTVQAGTVPAKSPPPPERPGASWSDAVANSTNGTWLTILLIGGDAGYLRSGLRADTLIVASINVRSGRVAAFSIPRNLEQVPLQGAAGREYGRFPDLLNALYKFGHSRPDLFPGGRDPGATALKQTLAHLLGIPIHYYALVDLRGFVEVIDALGGVRVYSTEWIVDETSPAFPGEPWTAIDLSPGYAKLDGREALAYARSRWQSSDYRRMKRQRCLLASLADGLDPVRVLRSLPKLLKTVKAYVSTDIPRRRLPDLVELVTRINPWTSVGVSFNPPLYTTYSPELEPFRSTVRQVLLSSPRELRMQAGLRALAGSCKSPYGN
jgi:LCP family protein required for cell wall assembly